MSFFHMSLMLLYHILTFMASGTRPSTAGAAGFSLGTTRAVYMGVLAPFVIWGVERIAFRTSHFLGMLQYRLTGPVPSTTTARSGNLME